jgi:hypothetical protein
MKAKILSEPIDKIPSDTLVLSIFKDEKPLKGANGLVDWRLCGKISKLLTNKTVTGEYKETALIVSPESSRAPRILIVGLGDSKEFNEKRLKEVAAFIGDTLRKINAKQVSLAIPGSSYFPQNYAKSAEIIITAFAGSYKKRSGLLEMIIFETGRRLAMVCEGAKHAKSILKNNLLLTLDV